MKSLECIFLWNSVGMGESPEVVERGGDIITSVL